VIGVRVSFDHVVSESEALFNGVPAVGNGMLFTRVSSTMFDGPGDVLAAGKVVGLQTIKNRIGGDVSVPLLELIGVYNCANGACSGFWSE
jgi:hypothetical protein